MPLPRYDPERDYAWNYAHPPDPPRPEGTRPPAGAELPVPGGPWEFCGLPVDSPLGIPAGPLLNGGWVRYYAALGYDVLTYKTVRTLPRACYPLPNLVPVRADELQGGERDLPASRWMTGSWAISFGMPSRSPDVWRRDVEETRAALPAGKLLVVSVVGSPAEGWSLEELAEDYALAARWAVESGADAVEANLSCPNVASADAQLYQQPESAARVAAAVRGAAGGRPVLLKIGHVTDAEAAAALAEAVAPHVSALSMVNCLAATVRGRDNALLFRGLPRGIGGAAIREAALAQVELFAGVVRERGLALRLVGVGGVRGTGDVQRLLAAGAHAVQLATAAMVEPGVAGRIKSELAAAGAGGGGT